MSPFEIIFAQSCEAIYFGLFMLNVKGLTKYKKPFITMLILEYVLLKTILTTSIFFHVIYTVLVYITLKLLHKNETKITDVFIFGVASLYLMVISVISIGICYLTPWHSLIVHGLIVLIGFLPIRKRLRHISVIYDKIWDRQDDNQKSFRAWNIIIFNVMFYIINLSLMHPKFILCALE